MTREGVIATMRGVRPLAALAFQFLVACGGEATAPTPAPAPRTVLEGEAVAGPPAGAEGPGGPSSAERTAEAVAERAVGGSLDRHDETLRARARELRAARALAHDGDVAAAHAAFQALLATAPRSPRLLCEAGYVAQRAGETSTAERELELGVTLFGDPEDVSAELRVPLAMCLYNRGRAHETAGRAAEAAADYRASISLRPNDTVAARLGALAAPAAAPEVATEPAVTFATLEEAVASVRDLLCGPETIEPESLDSCRMEPDRAVATPDFTLHLVEGTAAAYGMCSWTGIVAVAEQGSRFRWVGEIYHLEDPGGFTAVHGGVISITSGGAPGSAWVRVSAEGGSESAEGESWSATDARAEIFCALSREGEVACGEVLVDLGHEESSDDWTEDEGSAPEPRDPELNWSATLAVEDDGSLTIESSDAGYHGCLPRGAHRVADVVTTEACRDALPFTGSW